MEGTFHAFLISFAQNKPSIVKQNNLNPEEIKHDVQATLNQ